MADIDLTPTEEMAANAKRGLELRRKHGRGGTAVGVARARDISNRKTLSPETVRRMHAFFSRHEKNKAGGEDDAGYIAWMLWSGDAGQGWAKRKVEQMDKSENQRSETYKAIAERLGSAAKFAITKEQIRGASREELRSIEQRLMALAKSGDKNAAALLDYVEEEYNDRYRGTHARPGAKAKMGANEMSTPEAIAKMMEAWNKIEAQAKKQFPNASKEEIYRITKDAMNHALRTKFSRPGAKASFAQDARAVAQEILRQLGGGRFMAMVGGKNAMHGMFGGKPGLQVSIGKGAEGGINRLIVTLDPATDTYDMEFWRIGNRGLSTKKVSEASMVYADDLQRVFTDRTKFYTSMSRPGAKATMGKETKYRVVLESRATGKNTDFRTLASSESDARVQARAAYGDKWEVIAVVEEHSRPGAKARFGMTNAGYKALVDAIRVYGVSAPADVVAQAKQMKQEPTEFTDNEVMAVIAKMKQARASRPGAKARFATEVGRKGNKAAMITRDGTGTWYAYVVQRGETGIGPFEDMLGTMRSYATEEKAKRAAIKALDTSGFSRPGAKARMAYGVADAAPKFTKGETVADAVHPNRKGKVVEVIPGSYDAKSYTKAENQYIVSFMPKGGLVRYGEQRLVRASRPGAKAKMGMRDTKGRGPFTLQYIASGLYGEPTWLLVDKANKVVAKEHNEQSAKEMLRKANAGEPVYVSSRPGAKAKFGYEKSINIMLEDARIPDHAYDWRNGVLLVDSEYHDRIVSVLKSYVPWEIKSLPKIQKVQMSRPGAKARFAEVDYGYRLYVDGRLADERYEIATEQKADADAKAALRYRFDVAKVQTPMYVEVFRFGEMGLKVLRRYFKIINNGSATLNYSRPGAKDTNAVREGSKISAEDEACLKMMAAANAKVSDKIRTLIAEGKPQKQAVAIALDLKRRGEL